MGPRAGRVFSALLTVLSVVVSLVRPFPVWAAETPTPVPKPTPTLSPRPTQPPVTPVEITPTPVRTESPATATPRPTPPRTAQPATASPKLTPTPSPTPVATPTPVVTPNLTSTPPPACAVSAPNLVQNPGFETVSASGGPSWHVLDVATTEVSGWTRTSAPALVDWVKTQTDNLFGVHLAYQGVKYAVLLGYANFVGRPSLVGTLVSPTAVGATYVLSARIVQSPANDIGPVAIEMRLRRSSDGAESPAVHAIVADLNNWVLVSGTVMANVHYDRVVLRAYQEGGTAFVDDVRVCRAEDRPWWLNKGVVGAGGGVVVILIGATAFGARRFRTRGRNASATVRG